MAPRATTEPPRLMLRIEVGAGATERLAAALAAAPFASVILATADGRPLHSPDLAALIMAGQRAGAAVLVEGDGAVARASGADGVHLRHCEDPVAAYAAARAAVGNRAVVGADAGGSRHDAMSLGEAGADYVAFGRSAHGDERALAGCRQLELIAWWAEIFEVPCVALDAPDSEAAGRLARAGADFVCLPVMPGSAPGTAAAEARAWSAALDAASSAASGH